MASSDAVTRDQAAEAAGVQRPLAAFHLDKLADQRVAVVGTGASAIQIVPFLGQYAKQLYVLQRTPPSVDSRPNPPTDPAWASSLQPGWQKQRQENFHRGALEGFRPGDTDLVCDFWTEINRNIAAKLAAQGWPEITPETFMAMREVEDYHVMERFRRRIDEIVQDKATAAALKPWFRFHCKRPLSSDTYYPTFNRPNVQLIDVRGSPASRPTASCSKFCSSPSANAPWCSWW